MIIAQISDPHIRAGVTAHVGDQSGAHLERAIQHLIQLPAPPDVVLVTGDCAESGSVAEYARFRELLRPLSMPVYVIPGNHDDRANLIASFGAQGDAPLAGFVQYVVDVAPVRLIALDTNIPGHGAGYLCAERLGWLEQRLAEAPDRPTLLFMHHPPFPTGLAPFDQIGLENADALGAIVARHPQIERIVAGHVHSTLQRRFHGTIAMTCSSTAYRLLPDLQRPVGLAAIMEPPVCLLHVWGPASGLITYTSQIGEHGDLVDLHDGEKWLS
jgi:3',5'-cyclic AMP phosphodiesterase CpdA